MAFEAFLTQDQDRTRPRRWRRITYALSLALHGALLLAAVGHSFWRVDELQPRRVAVHFLLSQTPAPPPPLPPAPVPLATPTPRVAAPPRARSTAQLHQPRRLPPPPAPAEPVAATEPSTEPTADLPEGDPAASAPGDTAGVAGGDEVVVAAAPPPPPPAPPAAPPAAINLAPQMGIQLRTTDLNDPRFRPTLPPALNRGGMVIAGLFRICVSAQGQVKDVSVMKSADPLVDQAWAAVIRTWEYRPYSVAGHAVGFCHAARIEVRAQS